MHIASVLVHCILSILCISCHNYGRKSHSQEFPMIVYCHYCLVPHPSLRAQLFKFTSRYHHLQPSLLFADLSQKAPGKSAAASSCRQWRMAKGIVPVAPTVPPLVLGQNKRTRDLKASQYGGHSGWTRNHIQSLSVSVCLFTAFIWKVALYDIIHDIISL
jgi:hypothetical protein